MDSALEYISAGMILALILGVTAQYSTSMVSDRIHRIEQSSKVEIADRVIDSILLSTGHPSDWDQSVDPPITMGFALEGSVKQYQLDRGKVNSLGTNSINYIAPYKIRDLIGLSPNYYISLEIYPIYTISIRNITNEKFIIAVTNQWNKPVSTAEVVGWYTDIVNLNSTEIATFVNGSLVNATTKTVFTDAKGECTLDFTGLGLKSTLVVQAKQLGIKSLNTWPKQSDDLIYSLMSSMGDPEGFNSEVVYRNVEIDEINYFCKVMVWWG